MLSFRSYDKYEDLSKEYTEGLVHPGDLKKSTAKQINEMMEPVRQHFANDPQAKQLLEIIRSYTITR